jgi:hypothetical protein
MDDPAESIFDGRISSLEADNITIRVYWESEGAVHQ